MGDSSAPSSPEPERHEEASSILKDEPSSIKDEEEQKAAEGDLENLSTTPGANQEETTNTTKRRGFCRGKTPDDAKSEGETPTGSEAAPKAQPKRRSRGLCRGKAPAEETSEGEQTP